MRPLYRGAGPHLEFECGEAQIRASKRISGLLMTSLAIASESDSFRHRARRVLEQIRAWPANGNSPYSPVFCVSLLLAVGLIIEIGR
jgi:hypothetical protein